MIHFVLIRAHRYTVEDYRKEWAGAVAAKVDIVTYELVRDGGVFPGGVYVFGDIDRLSPPMRQIAAEFHAAVIASGNAALNDPVRSMRRFDLLRNLHESRENLFNVYRVVQGELPARFPVFLRLENAHLGNLTKLIESHATLEAEMARVMPLVEKEGYRRTDVIAVEFLDTSRSGLFRKYGTYFVRDHVMPRSIFFSTKPLAKRGDIVNADTVKEEEAYVGANPHADELLAIAKRANIQFGRFDYAVLDGRVQVWEINTNPEFGRTRRQTEASRLHLALNFADRMGAALAELDEAGGEVLFAPTPALVAESRRPEHSPPVFIRPPAGIDHLVHRLPDPVRRGLRRVVLPFLR